MMQSTLGFRCAAVLLSVARMAAATGQTIDHRDVRFQSESIRITLSIPDSWDYQSSTKGEALNVTLSPREGRDARVLVTAFPIPDDSPISSQDDLRELVSTGGERLLPSATQDELELQSVKTPSGQGYVYRLTDARSDDTNGNYREMAQGAFLLDGHLLTTTILTHSGDELSFTEAMRIVESIKREEAR